MRKRTIAALLTILLAASAHSAEKTIVLGAEDRWQDIAAAEGIVVMPGRQGYDDVYLMHARHRADAETELLLDFDSLPVADATGNYTVTAPGYQRKQGAITLRVPPDTRIVWVHGLIGHRDAESEADAANGTLRAFHRVDGGTVTLNVPGKNYVFDFHWGDFTGYVHVHEDGSGEVSTRRIILLDPDPNAGAQTATADPADPENIDGFSERLKTIWEQAPEDLRKMWLRMGLMIALKKDIEAITSGGYKGNPDNVQKYIDRWENGGYKGKMYNALWTLQESIMLMPHASLSTASDMETHAKNAKQLYQQLKGETLQTQQGAGPLQPLVQKIIADQEAGLGW